ncbi:MAG: metallophosphoesterase [Eubacteriaceae bacterium]
MYANNRLYKVFNTAPEIPFDNSSKFVLMSDCHRGDGSWADTFSKNQNIYFSALTYYYNENYTYIEIGDGDELWENKSFLEIIENYSNIFWLLSKFYNEDRLYLIYGNHDMEKSNKKFIKNNLYYYYNERKKEYIPLLNNIKIHQGLILEYTITGDKIFLLHGHQVNRFNDSLWRLARFLVRYLWKPLELIGINDPTSTAKDYKKSEFVDKQLSDWVIREKHMLIAGHTHRPKYPEIGEVPYFNDGSCVHPRCITGIEIEYGLITLVKWTIKTKSDGTLFVSRVVLAGPRELKNYFKIFKEYNK